MIELIDIVKYYDKKLAVDHLNLKVEDGDICVLLGESGCGKSTTLNMINRLIDFDSGDILIDGKSIIEQNQVELRRKIGYVVQSTGLFPHMTVEKNICVVPELLGWTRKQMKERARELLNIISLDPDEYLEKYPSQLSGGEAQRVGVARAIASKPAIILMDEPFGAVDPINRISLQDNFLALNKKLRKTVIFVTHDIAEAIKMGDKIALMDGGKIVSYGSPNEVLNDQNPFVKNFMGTNALNYLLGNQLVSKHMSTRVLEQADKSIESNKSLQSALSVMIEYGIKELNVLGSSGDVCGSISIDEILSATKEEK